MYLLILNRCSYFIIVWWLNLYWVLVMNFFLFRSLYWIILVFFFWFLVIDIVYKLVSKCGKVDLIFCIRIFIWEWVIICGFFFREIIIVNLYWGNFWIFYKFNRKIFFFWLMEIVFGLFLFLVNFDIMLKFIRFLVILIILLIMFFIFLFLVIMKVCFGLVRGGGWLLLEM